MERGLLWLPLLVLFCWLAWSGWNEYQKVEAYRVWAQQFDRAKYDIYAVLGQSGRHLTWGKPTRKGTIDLQTISLDAVQSVQLRVDSNPVDLTALPSKGRTVELALERSDSPIPTLIPFTEIPLAAQWATHLQQELSRPT